MKRVVHTGLPEFGRPTEHAVMADGHLRTMAVPLKMDGTFETGDARSQIALALENLEKTVKAAGGEITDVVQALCFLPTPITCRCSTRNGPSDSSRLTPTAAS
jgi:enamine deaminase RidA (YjgF/YER057c/UK114 family)